MIQLAFEAAGELGVSPLPFSLRQLTWMLEARRLAEWDRLASLMSLIANCNRGPKSRTFGPLDFHPLRRKEQPVMKLSPREFVQAMAGILGGAGK